MRKSLDQAGFKDVSVSQDRDKGVVTLGGQVASDGDNRRRNPLPNPSLAHKLSPIRLPLFLQVSKRKQRL
jgi:hypothetical protein